MILKTHNSSITLEKDDLISNSTTQIKLLKRTNKPKSLKNDRSLSQSSIENSFPVFFIKKIPKLFSKNNEEQVQTTDVTPIKQILKKNEEIGRTQKKRLPTPSKSYRQITDYAKTNKKLQTDDINIQKQMQIHDLEKKLSSESKIRIFFQQKAKQFQNQVSVQAKKVKGLQKQLFQVQQRQRQFKQKVKQLQRSLEMRNADLKNTRSNLQKLKDNIKQVRTQDFQNEIKKLRQEVERAKVNSEKQQKLINYLRNENTDLKMQVQQIKSLFEHNKLKAQEESKVSVLKRQIEQLKHQIQMSKNDKQRFLELKIFDLEKQMVKISQISKSKTIQIDFLQRKKYEEIQLVKKRKGHQIKSLRMKYSALMDQYKGVHPRRHHSKSKDPRNKSHQKKSSQRRQNRFACPSKDHQDEYISFSLSPECK